MLKGVISYWMLPLFSAVVWLAMLLAMLIHWLTQGKPHYSYMAADQTIAYISDVGASDFKPLFIAMGTVSVVTFDLAFCAERWLRHAGRLVHNTSRVQKFLAVMSIIFAIIGAAGLILLSIFDTKNHHTLHDTFLVVFIGGYVISAIFVCAEYQRLGIHFRQFRILRISFWVKLFFIFIELGLAIAFGVLNVRQKWNNAAIVEWVIALVYSFYVLSFAIDFLPATKTKHHQSGQETMEEQAMAHSEVYGHHNPTNGTNSGYYPSGSSAGQPGWHRTGESTRPIV
ncbi:hypothetical protein BT63DRAFT_385696 [Microthyrium microscopicum]|uniref:CWH43-like N-terminal domain-containing protein n=1 Tax=Microthyrium microscopicum TaxID=703497 RepID=A0A6A6UHC6_9PEZI|nr:hypothetical protein BT63DRAFT_385696 [Microthyrium microscopicum]